MTPTLAQLVAVTALTSRPTPRWGGHTYIPAEYKPPDVSEAAAAVAQLLESDEQLTLANGWRLTLTSRLGEGRFGNVLLGESAEHGSVAVKMILHPTWDEQLSREAAVLRALDGVKGFPALLHHEPGILVMERLGPSLEARWQAATAGTYFSGPKVLRLGRAVLCCLRRLHEAGFVHNDLKPSNVLLGEDDEPRLIDFGLATHVATEDADGGSPTAPVDKGARVGTPLFASIAGHEGRRTRAADDVESLVYCLAFLASGGLPWQHKRHAKALAMKRRMVTDGCELMTDSCAAERLTEDVHSRETADALQALWAEVVVCHEAGDDVDYDACLAALRGAPGGGCEGEGGGPDDEQLMTAEAG